MPTFAYIALDKEGKNQKGSVTAESAAAARKQLRTRHLHATELRPVAQTARGGHWELPAIFRTRRRRTVLEFTRQIGTMIGAEIKLTEALGVLIAQTQTGEPKFAAVLQNVRDQVLAGESLHDGLKAYPGWFDPVYLAMVRVGEVTGNLARSFNLLAVHMGKKLRLEAKLKSALTYPAILVVVAIIVTIILMTFVVPTISDIIIKSGRPLPPLTQAMLGISKAMINYWYLWFGGIGSCFWAFRKVLSSEKGRYLFDKFVLRLPVFGQIIKQNVVARFTSTLSALIKSGLPMAESLQVVSDTTGNVILGQAIRAARERIIAGADVATPLRNSGVVGPAVAHMIAVGERSGELETMLITISEGLEENADISIQRISSVVEPIIIILMAIVVGIILMATIQPILQMTEVMK